MPLIIWPGSRCADNVKLKRLAVDASAFVGTLVLQPSLTRGQTKSVRDSKHLVMQSLI